MYPPHFISFPLDFIASFKNIRIKETEIDITNKSGLIKAELYIFSTIKQTKDE